ncbi:hypothetical protein OLMES_2780 [Oleiphilus messinensis]|uniref:Uncharacterized protein n=1 Tax=Oleiphilus messinensis TaxID=141451 RepID=A0A1Y0I8L4_9GAMM|nr:hypothetical protein OLMES_2780 [Oleiphilus messinensis]
MSKQINKRHRVVIIDAGTSIFQEMPWWYFLASQSQANRHWRSAPLLPRHNASPVIPAPKL